MGLNKNSTDKINLEQLISNLKVEDTRYSRLSRGLQILYWIFIPVYSIIAILSFVETRDINLLIGGGCFVVSFLIFAIFFGKYYKEYKYVDYSLPTLVMLKNAAYRYKPFQLKTIWILIAILFMDAGLFLNSSPHFLAINFQIYFLGAMAIALIIGLIIWSIKYKPLRDNALFLISEIEGE